MIFGKKNFFSFLVCALMFVGMSLPMQVAAYGYVKIQMVSKHETGITPESSAHVYNGNSDYCLNKEFWVDIIPAKLTRSGYTSYNKENLIGIYRDEACTQLVASGDPGTWATSASWQLGPVAITQNDEDIVHYYATKAEADDAEPDVLYALFGYPKVTSQAGENITITDPYGSGTGYTWFKVANVTKNYFNRELWPYTYQTGKSDLGYTTNAITTGSWTLFNTGWMKQPATYTATNIHSGNNYVCYTYAYVFNRESGAQMTTNPVYVIFYVDLQPRFELEADALDWSHTGETLVETFDVGNEVAASKRSRLQNKLVCKSANTNNNTVTAKNYATWTVTITGANADQFKFANGTQTVTGTYSADLLDVIYAPTTAGTHTATLHIETSYTDAKGTTLTYNKDVTLSGTAAVNSKITFTKAGNDTPSASETHDFGDIIGTNAKDITADLFISQMTNLTKTWSDPDGAFIFDENSVDLSKSFQTLNFRAKRSTPVTENTNHTATLTVSGKNASNEDVSATLTLSYTALPLLTPTVTWNWSSVKDNTVSTNPISTTSDGAWTLTKSAGERVIYDAENKTLTVPYLHHEPGVSADFALVIPQTDTYAAYHEVDSTEVNSAAPTNVYIDSQAKITQHISSYGSSSSWSNTLEYISETNAIRLPKYEGNVLFATNGQTIIEFDCPESIKLSILPHAGNKNLSYVLGSLFEGVTLPVGHYQYIIPAQATDVQFHKWNNEVKDISNIHYWEYDTIQSDYSQVALVKNGNAVSSLAVPFTFANKRQVTVSLNATAAQYFELSAEGKTPGASIVFDETDGLAVYETINKTVTVSLKSGASAKAAQQATMGNACMLTLADSYTYDHEEQSLPILVLAPAEINYKHAEHGTYTVTYQQDNVPHEVSGEDYKKVVSSGEPSYYVVTLSAPTPAEGYTFQGWKIDGKIASGRSTFTTSIGKSCDVEAVFGQVEGRYFQVGDAVYDDLNDALAAANTATDSKIVTVINDVVLGDGTTPVNYTIPAGVTLLVPHKADFYELQENPEVVNATETLTAYRLLMVRPGVTITCNGNICVAGKIMSAGGGKKSAYTTGACGVINMANGGQIELNDGANLYCWGYIKGQDMDQGNNTIDVGSVNAKAGSTIWENFELGDWRGGTASLDIYLNNEDEHRQLFPFQSYAIQNVEIPMTFNYGSVLRTYTTITTGYGNHGAVFSMIGPSETMFLLKDAQSKVRTWYDPTTDLSCYELSGTAQLDAIHITVYISMSSENFILPVANSMHIILSDCDMTLANPLMVQAGAVVEIKPSATVNLTSELYMYDVDQWGKYVHNYYFRSFNNLTSHKSRGAEDSKAGLDDAKLIVDGTFNIENGGKIYATAGGANIMGNHGGVINFNTTLPTETILWAVEVKSGAPYITWVNNPVYAANLCNEDGSYTRSIGNKFFINVNGRWFVEAAADPKANHTYAFTYMSNGNAGDDVNTVAVYSHDKTGLEARMKWFNVEEDGCENWWVGTTPSAYYNYTMLGEWHQFIATENAGEYSGSDNKLYEKNTCAWTETGAVDENCLYTVGGVKKALVNGSFIALESNADDPAYHAAANASQYYICFAGCNWHPATKYPNEEKAYTIVEDEKELIYIVYNGDWLLVEREDPYFFDYNEQNVKRYYEYVNGEWVLAAPRVRVTDEIETRDFNKIAEAFKVVNLKRNATITLLQDIPTITSALNYTALNTTCTLDLNGHVLPGSAAKVLNINAPGSTFIIKDSQTDGTISVSGNANSRISAVEVQNGTLELQSGKLVAENANTGATSSNIYVATVYVAADAAMTMTGGEVEGKRTSTGSYGYGIYSNGTLDVYGGSVTGTNPNGAYAYAIYVRPGATATLENVTCAGTSKTNSRAVLTYGNTTIKSGTYTATTTSTGSVALYVYGGTITVDGGTFTATGTTTITGMYVSQSGVSATINGGIFSAKATSNNGEAYGAQVLNSASLTTTGGSFVAEASGTPGTSTRTIKAYGLKLASGTATLAGTSFEGKTTGNTKNVNAVPNGAVGIYAETSFTATNCSITATTKAIRAYALYVTSGTVVATGCSISGSTTYTTSGESIVRGVNGSNKAANITLNGGEINMTGVSGKSQYVYGVFSYGTTTINGTTIKLTDASSNSAALYPYDPNANLTVNSGKFNGGGYYALKINSSHLPKSITLNGGYYSTNDNLDTYKASGREVKTLASTHAEYANGYRYEVNYPHTITWDANGGELSGEYTSGGVPVGTTIVPPTATREGYIFSGWTPDVAETMPEQDLTYTAQWTQAVASVTVNDATTPYATLAAAITAANSQSNATITMLQNASVASEQTISATMTIDLNGKTISSTHTTAATGIFKINAPGKTITITDSGTNGKISHKASCSGKLYGINMVAGALNIEGGTIYAENTTTSTGKTYRAIAIYYDTNNTQPASITMSGGTVEVKRSSKSYAYAIMIYTANCDLTITGGEVKASGSTIVRGIYTQGTAELSNVTVSATASGDNCYAVFSDQNGIYTINSGTYTATGSGSSVCALAITQANARATVNGGRFKGSSKELNVSNGTVSLKGGYYAHNTGLASYKATGYQVTATTAEEKASIGDAYNYKVEKSIHTITWQLEGVTVRTDQVAYGETPEYGSLPTKPSTEQYEYSFAGWTPAVVPVTGDATYSGSFYETPREYTITFVNDDETVLQESEVAYGETPEFIGTPVSSHTDGYYTFIGWSPEITAVTGTATYTAQYSQQTDLIINDGETVHVEANTVVGNTIVRVGGKLDVASGITLTTENLILEATPSESGEIIGLGTITATNAYFDYKANAVNHLWYAVAVPWQVDANTGISVNGRTLNLGSDFDIIYYDGARRAEQGKQKCWSYVQNDADQTLVPGRLYMIGLMMDAPTIRFTKKAGENPLLTTTTSVEAHNATTGNNTDANWNGVANPALFHAYLSPGTPEGQVYIPAEKRYEPIDMSAAKMVVGQGAFVQAPANKNIEVSVSGAYAAPRRARAEAVKADVRIAPAEADYTDRLFVKTTDSKEADVYTIGQDLAKVGVSSQVAQMWVDRYGEKLCVNTQAWSHATVTYPLGISIPTEGEYTISCQPSVISDQYDLYLTLDGRVIWNLCASPYTAYMEAGTSYRYGLRMIAKSPQTPTGMDEAIIDANGETRKVLINNQVFIIREGEVYTVTGMKVEGVKE